MKIYIAEELYPFGDHDWIALGYHKTIEGAAKRLNIPYTEENFPSVY